MEEQAKRSKFFDVIDNIDRYLYGRKMKNFILGSIFVLILAPILDEWLEVPHDRLTFLMTWVFFLYVLVIFLAWISTWRDDQGGWTLARAKSRVKTYITVLRDTAQETKTTSKDEMFYKAGWGLFFGGLCWKACQNLSLFIRKPIESLFHRRIVRLRNFELYAKHWYWVAILFGVGIMIYLYRSNPKILARIKKDLLLLFMPNRSLNSGYNNELLKIDADKLVVNNKTEGHIKEIASADNTNLFQNFVAAIKSWSPGKYAYEYEFQDALYRHLKKTLPESSIQLEYPIGSKAQGNKGRADIVIDETILIEMKRDSSAGAVQRAKGQILQYSDIWRNRGPVILLLCDHNFEHAKLSYTSTMADLSRLERPALTIVAEN